MQCRMAEYPDMFRFFQKIISFRKKHPSIGRSRFWREDVKWFGPRGTIDYSPASRSLAFYLNGNDQFYGLRDKDIYVMINNNWEEAEFEFQIIGDWYRVVNTNLTSPEDIISETKEKVTSNNYLVGKRACAVFVK